MNSDIWWNFYKKNNSLSNPIVHSGKGATLLPVLKKIFSEVYFFCLNDKLLKLSFRPRNPSENFFWYRQLFLMISTIVYQCAIQKKAHSLQSWLSYQYMLQPIKVHSNRTYFDILVCAMCTRVFSIFLDYDVQFVMECAPLCKLKMISFLNLDTY